MESAAKKPPPQAAAPTPAAAPGLRQLKKGDLLFNEGETSRAMYLLKSGIIRIFKKKGDSDIELDTARSGQILGELAFLDGNPRSASGEALTDCSLIEISGPAFYATLSNMPDWLKILLKTIVGRLRSSNTRIRQLESASSSYDYSEKEGKRSPHYTYLSPPDVLKGFSAVLLAASRHGKPIADGTRTAIEFNGALLQRYGNQIMQVPMAKIASLLDILAQIGAIKQEELEGGATKVTLLDAVFVEGLISYMNDENLCDPTKRHDISVKGFILLSYIAKHLDKFPKSPGATVNVVNIAQVKKLETSASGKEPFRLDDFAELVKLGYATTLDVRSQDEVVTQVTAETVMLAFRYQRAVMAISAANDQKRKTPSK